MRTWCVAPLKRLFILLSLLSSLLIHHSTMASTAPLFSVLASGTAAKVSITLCLNGKGALSCQNYTVSALNLMISPTVADHLYPGAGIKVNTPGFVLTGCTPIGNGYCLFATKSAYPAHVFISPAAGSAILSSSVSSLALSVNCTTNVLGCVYFNAALTGTARQITITNTGTEVASDVLVHSSGLPTGTIISSNTCSGSLAPSMSCAITITPGKKASTDCTLGNAPINSSVTITATRAIAKQVNVWVLSYGCIYQEGYVYAIDDSTANTGSIGGKVTTQMDQVSPNNGVVWSANSSGVFDGGVSLWGIDDSSTTMAPSPNASSFDPATQYPGQANCDGATNGACNSNNINIYYGTVLTPPAPRSSYAAGICGQLIVGRYSDWYLPAICEMGPDEGAMICTAPPLSQLQQNMVDSLPILITNCTGSKCLAGDYWSSTEQSGNPSDNAWSECFASGNASDQCIDLKSETLGVRCSRNMSN